MLQDRRSGCDTAVMDPREQVERHSAHNYHPLPVGLAQGDGAWVTDIEGKRYLDSSLNARAEDTRASGDRKNA